MNIVICTHQRIEITTYNIKTLIGKANIVLVVSDKEEEEYFRQYPIHVRRFPNSPLGAKWQHGVDEARKLGGPIMILGSDDILEPNCIDRYRVLLSEGHDFIGLKRWWIHHQGKAYLCEYLADQPLGGGRCYSERLLRRIRYSLFHVKHIRRLDDHGWRMAGGGLILNEGLIHAVKGDWPVLNPFNIRHKNIKLIRTDDSERVLPKLPS